MKIFITSINFNYKNGYDGDYTSVNLYFNSTGSTFNLNGFVEVTSDEYASAAGDTKKLEELVRKKVEEKIQDTTATTTAG